MMIGFIFINANPTNLDMVPKWAHTPMGSRFRRRRQHANLIPTIDHCWYVCVFDQHVLVKHVPATTTLSVVGMCLIELLISWPHSTVAALIALEMCPRSLSLLVGPNSISSMHASTQLVIQFAMCLDSIRQTDIYILDPACTTKWEDDMQRGQTVTNHTHRHTEHMDTVRWVRTRQMRSRRRRRDTNEATY